MLALKNEAAYIRRDCATRLLKHYFAGTLVDTIDTIPIDMIAHDRSSHRCCVYKDRAMIRLRILALLGFSIEADEEERRSLKSFATEALNRKNITEPVLTMLSMACSSCTSGTYRVTNLCRGCVARPCLNNCPKKCITFVNGVAEIDSELCVKCGKCESLCPFNAISYQPIPCETHCPVGALSRDSETGAERIDYERCVSCGKCTRSCPFGAVMERSQIIDVAQTLTSDSEVIALIAPSIVGQFPGTLDQVVSALHSLGFSAVYDVAAGADITAQREAAELQARLDEGAPCMATSCCPAYTETVEKHVPEFRPFLSHTKPPLYYSAEMVRQRFPKAKTVFIGPCVAKRVEGIRTKQVDFVLTFEELGSFFLAKGIQIEQEQPGKMISDDTTSQARGFALSRGVAAAVIAASETVSVIPHVINGVDRKALRELKRLAKTGGGEANIIEVMSCEGGCLYGPGVTANPSISKRALEQAMKEE